MDGAKCISSSLPCPLYEYTVLETSENDSELHVHISCNDHRIKGLLVIDFFCCTFKSLYVCCKYYNGFSDNVIKRIVLPNGS